MRGGVLPVRVSGPAEALQIQLASPPARQLATGADAAPETLLALAANGHVPELWDNGARWWLLPLRDAAAGLGAGHGRPARLEPATEATGVAVFADEAGTDHTRGGARILPRRCGQRAGRSGHRQRQCPDRCLAAAAQRPARPRGPLRASQGREVGRDGRVHVEVDAQGTVWIGGQVQPVIDGHLRW